MLYNISLTSDDNNIGGALDVMAFDKKTGNFYGVGQEVDYLNYIELDGTSLEVVKLNKIEGGWTDIMPARIAYDNSNTIYVIS